VEHRNSQRSARYAPVLSNQMTPSQKTYAPGTLAQPVLAARGRRTWVTDLLFWTLFVTDVFGICYWPVSRLSGLLVQSRILPLRTATITELVLSGLLTPGIIKATILLFRRTE